MSRNFARAVPTIAAITVLTAGLAAAPAPAALAAKRRQPPPPKPPAAAPAVTRAALDPALVAGRGADLGFAEQEAENAATNGTIIGPGTSAYTLPAEASGRSAVSLTPGQYVEFTLPSAANAINVRYSIPDAPSGGGITAPLERHGQRRRPPDHDPHLAVRLALQPVPVLQRPECRPAVPRPVDNRMQLRSRPDDAGAGVPDAVPAEPLLRRGTPAAAPHLPGRREDPAGRSPRQRRRDDDHRPDGQPVRTAAEDRRARGERGPVRRRSDRTARLRRRVRPGDRVRPPHRPAGLHPAGPVPGGPAHHRRQRDDRGSGQLVLDRLRPPGHAGQPGAGRLGAHRGRLLRQGRLSRRQQQRPPVRLRDRG